MIPGDAAKMLTIKPDQLILIAGFVLPGAISMYIYGFKVPQKDFRLQERIVEAICFSLLNFMIVWIPVRNLMGSPRISEQPWAEWLVLIAAFVCAPAVWPFALVSLLRWTERRGWISIRAHTAWDDFFSRQRSGCWLQVELNDGRVFGGRFGRRSYASAYPDPGHLLIEELWKVDDEGYFTEPWPGNAGLLLRPTDYRLVRVYKESEE
jgi:uncharacterized protein DUF6338